MPAPAETAEAADVDAGGETDADDSQAPATADPERVPRDARDVRLKRALSPLSDGDALGSADELSGSDAAARASRRGRPRRQDSAPPARSGRGRGRALHPPTPPDLPNDGKIDGLGYLYGGREWKIRAFNLPRHPRKVYLLMMDVSKCLGFENSTGFYTRYGKFERLYAQKDDRSWLVDEGHCMAQLKGRAMIICTARAAFKAFGHLLIVNGQPGKDDY
ncbi:hypothetical protein CXG81DRAFT_14288, partial [Caulochytrium protostelioides]